MVRPGDEVVALPSGQKTRVDAIVTFDGELREAFAPMSVTLRLKDEIDLSRGDMLVAAENLPQVSRTFRAMVVWLHAQPLEAGRELFGEAYGAADEDSGYADSPSSEREYARA